MRRRRNADRNARRRAEKHGVIAADNVSRDEIRRRDCETCYLCHRFVSVHEMTLDHVVPLVQGGTHTLDNLRLVHRACNSKKGTRQLSEIELLDF